MHCYLCTNCLSFLYYTNYTAKKAFNWMPSALGSNVIIKKNKKINKSLIYTCHCPSADDLTPDSAKSNCLPSKQSSRQQFGGKTTFSVGFSKLDKYRVGVTQY